MMALHVARRDLLAAFSTPLAWLVIACWSLVTNAVFVFGALYPLHGTPGSDLPLYVSTLYAGIYILMLLAPALTMNAFAAEQGANPLTVAKAYQQFQADGLVEVQRGVGMYVVAGAADKLRRAERESFLAEEWPEIRDRIDRLGIALEQLLSSDATESV